MYLKKLETWDWENWQIFLNQYPLLDRRERAEVMQILTYPEKIQIEEKFPRLIELWVLNGVWPWYLMKWTRRLISWFFRGVRYEWHDIMYAIGWTEMDRIKADWGLMKYSLISINDWVKFWRGIYNPISLLFIYIASIIQLIPVAFCFLMVICFWRFWSFNYREYEIYNLAKG